MERWEMSREIVWRNKGKGTSWRTEGEVYWENA